MSSSHEGVIYVARFYSIRRQDSKRLVTPPQDSKIGHSVRSEFKSNPPFSFYTLSRGPGSFGPANVYDGSGSMSSPDFPRTGGTEAPENAIVLLPLYLLLLVSAL